MSDFLCPFCGATEKLPRKPSENYRMWNKKVHCGSPDCCKALRKQQLTPLRAMNKCASCGANCLNDLCSRCGGNRRSGKATKETAEKLARILLTKEGVKNVRRSPLRKVSSPQGG